MIPYLDLYEQKGPLLYFLFYLAALISESGYIGVFLVEVLCFAWFLYESARLILLWTKKEVVYGLMPFVALGLVVAQSFAHGTSAEELFLPVLALSLRITLQQMRKSKPLTFVQACVLGCAAGAALWFKYTFCGFFAGLALAVLLWYFMGKHLRVLASNIAGAAAGVGAISALILLWYWCNGALEALWQTYFVDNLTLYAREITALRIVQLMGSQTVKNWPWTLFAAVGILWLMRHWRDNRWELCAVVCSGLMLALFTLIGGRIFIYYFMILGVYAPLGIIALANWPPVGKLTEKGLQGIRAKAALALITILCMATAYWGCPNTEMMRYEKEDLPQYAFASTILAKKPDATVLNYHFLDGGFYYAAGILPSNRYFCYLNVPKPEMGQEQMQLIRDGCYDFVISRDAKTLETDEYEIVQQHDFSCEGEAHTYYLFEKTE